MTRRATVLLVVAALLGVPSAVLRAACLGNTCSSIGGSGPGRVPFCSLPEDLRAQIAAGYRQGRSPDVLAVTGPISVVGWAAAGQAPARIASWPSASPLTDTRVPIVFAGVGIRRDATVPVGTGLRQIAPTIAELIRFERPFPDVRSGRPIPRFAGGEVPRLVLEVAWKGVGTADLEADPDRWPFLEQTLSSGVGTLQGQAGSQPLDPAATLTTIGTGGLPSEHGITGTWLRNDRGEVVRAWEAGAPTSIIATLPDDLDEERQQRPRIGVVSSDASDRGIVGGTWYAESDRDAVVVASDRRARLDAVERLLRQGFGRDAVPDVIAVVMDGPVRSLDIELRRVVAAAQLAAGGSVLLVVAGTGSAGPPGATPIDAADLVRVIDAEVATQEPLIEAAVPGGLFLDQAALTRAGVTGQAAEEALLAASAPSGERVIADAFQGFAVSFGRYC